MDAHIKPAGGVETGWQVVLRSKNIYGPYEDRIVLAQGSTPINGPHQGALVDTVENGWWFIHFQDAGVYGRVVHLQLVAWQDGWPLMGQVNGNGCGEPILNHPKPPLADRPVIATPQTSDEFEAAMLGFQWQWNANHNDDWLSLGTRKHWLRLYPQFAEPEHLTRPPNLLLQKFLARAFPCEAALEFAPRQDGEEAGLIVVGESFATLGLVKCGGHIQLVLRINEIQKVVRDKVPETIKIRVAVQDGGGRFSFAIHDDFETIAQAFPARKGKWIGAKVGLYSLKRLDGTPSGHADFDYFRYI